METTKKQQIIIVTLIITLLTLLYLFTELTFGTEIQKNRDHSEFVSCLNKNNISVYVYKDSTQVEAQLSSLGRASKNLNKTYCHLEKEECEGIFIYPSWNINGHIIHGGVSIGALEQFSGCKINK